jgi:N-acetylmuramoyl-L-alanine amidase
MNVTKRLVVNRTKGRGGQKVDAIVMHVSEGSMVGMRSWFNDPASEVSAHYGISRKGEIEQYVDEADTAWSNGRVLRPTAALVLARPGSNPNRWTVSIEHEGTGKDDLTSEQRAASAWLVADIAKRHGIPLDRKHVIRHHEIYAGKTCPGAVNVEKVLVVANGAAKVTRRAPPIIVWSDYAGDWLLVTRHVSDTDWTYQPVSLISGGIKATTPLSHMPRT